MSDYEFILYATDDRIARITLNRPEKRNALNLGIREEIKQALKTAERDDSIAVIVIDAIGPAFSSGYDLSPNDPRARSPEGGFVSEEQFDGWTSRWADSCIRDWMTIWELMKPVVAKVHGYCLAGGTELMSMCDIAFVADEAIIGYPPMRAMTTPDVNYHPWKMSMAWAKYLQLTGNSITGKKAAEIGWVVKSFPEADLEAEVMREVRALASIDVGMLAANKAILNQAYEIQGMKTHMALGPQWHALSGRFRPGAGEFGRITETDGLKAAIAWRDRAFEGLDPTP